MMFSTPLQESKKSRDILKVLREACHYTSLRFVPQFSEGRKKITGLGEDEGEGVR